MANKKFFAGILVMALVFGMVVVSCDSEEADTWSNITSLSQVNGTWKGPANLTQTENGITIKWSGDYILVFNASAQTGTYSFTGTLTFSGNNIDSFWPGIKNNLTAEGFTANDSNYSARGTTVLQSGNVSLSDFSGDQINQKGTKLKLNMDGETVIFTKQ
jgi:hypothetical protein